MVGVPCFSRVVPNEVVDPGKLAVPGFFWGFSSSAAKDVLNGSTHSMAIVQSPVCSIVVASACKSVKEIS
jgi:hypothetical protein